MGEKKKILWVENDREWVAPFAVALGDRGYDVRFERSPLPAEQALEDGHYNLLILDVMVPTLGEGEEQTYPPNETQRGHDTGLVFYRRNRETLEKKNIPVLVFTVRMDRAILDAFLDEGLPRKNFATKFELRDTDDFVERAESLMR